MDVFMADVSPTRVAMALGAGLVLAVFAGLGLSFLAERRHGHGMFAMVFVTLVCVYAVGFAARYYLVEVLP